MQNYPNTPQGGERKPRKEKINECEFRGVIVARGQNDAEPIKVYTFDNGGAVIHANLKVSEYTGRADENGNPKMKTTTVPLNVNANKLITVDMLRSIVPGSTVRVVGRLENESYRDKQTGQYRSSLVVNAYVMEILQLPIQAQPYAPAAYPQPQYGAQPAYGQQQYGQGPFAPVPAPAYGQRQTPPAPAPAQPQGYPAQPQQRPAYGPVPAQPAAPARQGGYPAQQGQQGVPSYYVNPSPQQQPAPQAPAPAVEDMPDFGIQSLNDLNI